MLPLVRATREGVEIAGEEWRLLRPDGTSQLVACWARPIRAPDGAVVGAVAAWNDVDPGRSGFGDLRRAVAERDMLLKELSHRVKNSLQLVTSLLSLHARRLSDPADRDLFDDAATRINAIGRVHERLYRGANPTSVDVAEVLRGLCIDLTRTNPEQPCHIDAQSVTAASDKAITLALIVTELISNGVKHGRGGPRDRGIHIELTHGNESLRLAVRDHGPGLPDGFRLDIPRDSLGLTIVQALAGQLGATLEARDAAPGTCWVLRLPLASLQPGE
jgi:two-component sensor histidine kinase